MPVPTDELRPGVEYFLFLEAEAQGISVDSLRRDDLQTLALGLRLVSQDPKAPYENLQIANALDDLSVLGNTEIRYLERLAGKQPTR